MRKEIFNWFITIISLHHIHGHGRMEDPPARNAAWRYGFNVPANYDDVGLNCGGLSIQKANDGKCGVCGDSYVGPRDHEAGGRYATNIIVRNYEPNSLIDVKILLTANHVGFMEFRLCSLVNSNSELTQECLDQNLLFIEGFGTQYPVNEGIDSILLRLHIPSGLQCPHCVLQWRYHAGNSWGTDGVTGKSCLGCGHQEEFYNCADISIAPKDDNNNNNLLLPLSTTSTSTETPLFLLPFLDSNMISSENEYIPIFTYPTTTESATTTTIMNIIYPYQSSDELINHFNKKNKTFRCYPTNEVLKPLIGIENWCLQICAVNCPPTLCACVQI
ncbi:unnamed protein product [Adineta steineri]|uniref:Chitin-binding type-4 domain-containing protein n=1 Tax=Adineta steineri TaxID=433720 RepID=A0A813Z6A9_9BILA|nr:unnamed protein product [Adineta steineri]